MICFTHCFAQSSSLVSPTAPKNLIPVPIVRQATNYSCGPAALLSVLYYWKASTEAESTLYPLLQTDPVSGTHPVAIANYARSLGLKTELKTQVSLTEIEKAIDRQEPVLVDYQAWGTEIEKVDYSSVWESGHYGVVIGYDSKYLYLMDPVLSSSYGKLERGDFLKRWHDYETRNGKTEYYIQAAIFISGTEKLKQFPSAFTLIE